MQQDEPVHDGFDQPTDSWVSALNSVVTDWFDQPTNSQWPANSGWMTPTPSNETPNYIIQRDESVLDEFDHLYHKEFVCNSWMSFTAREGALQIAELTLNNFVRSARKAFLEGFSDTRFSDECYEFKCQVVAAARPLLECHQQVAEGYNAGSVIYQRLHQDVMQMVFNYATFKVQDGYEFPEHRDLRGTLSLASVTRSFRYLALGSSFLWNTIVVTEISIGIFDTLIERSNGRELHIVLDVARWYLVDPEILVSKIRGVAHRVRALYFNASFPDLQDAYIALVGIPFPIATVFSFAPVNSASVYLPSLRCLRADGYTVGSFSSHYQSVTFLELTRSNVADIVRLLPLTTRLQTLKVTLGFDWSEEDETADTILVHTGIRSLETDTQYLIERLTLPNLKSLVLLGDNTSLSDFIWRSKCTLTRFGMDCYLDQDGGTGMAFILNTPTIDEIYLEAWTFAQCGAVFKQLNAKLDPPGRILSVTLCMQDRSQRSETEPDHPYLFAPVLAYYDQNSRQIERIAVKTHLPFEFLGLWNKLYENMPAVVSVNGRTLTSFTRR